MMILITKRPPSSSFTITLHTHIDTHTDTHTHIFYPIYTHTHTLHEHEINERSKGIYLVRMRFATLLPKRKNGRTVAEPAIGQVQSN